MSNLPYKNPISPLQVYGSSTVDRSKTFGTNFSVLSTGGFMEVYSLSDLNYVIPIGETGNIEFSGNTIPVQFKKGTGSVFSPDVLTLNSDNISSGRRRLGMLVYVYETNKIYQHSINNYDNLWSAATGSTGPGGNTVVISDFGTTIKNNSVAGQNFINAWTASTIEGIDGYTNLDATWRELKTGGSGGTDTYVTGFSFSQETYVLTLNQNTDSEFSAFTANLAILASDVTITGGTYDSNTGVATFTNNSGASFDVSGFTSGLTNTVITSFTYDDSNTFTINDSSGNTFNATFNIVTGLTVNGTISATTYDNLPNTLYSGDGTLQNNRIVDLSSFTLNFSSSTNPDVLSLNNGSIGVGVSNPDSSSVFEISSTTKGFLGPRMSETERLSITSPAVGLIVYQTDNDEGYYIHKSFGWVQII